MSQDKYKPKKVEEENGCKKCEKVYKDILKKMMTCVLTLNDLNELDNHTLKCNAVNFGRHFRTTLESFKICCDHLLGLTESENDEKLDIYLLSVIIKGCLYPLHPSSVPEAFKEIASFSTDVQQVRLLSNIMHLAIKQANGLGVSDEEIEKLRKDAKKK